MSDLLTGPSYSLHSKPKKLIVMLHGYGDTAENFLYIANQLDEEEWGAQYISLNAPETIPNYSMGNQWFDIYPNGIYISDAGPNELAIIRQGVKKAIEKITNSEIKELVLTNSIHVSKEIKNSKKIRHISIAPLIGEAIKRIISDSSVSALFD